MNPFGWRAPLLLVVLAATFVVGIGLGEALHDRPSPGGTQTIVRTLTPLPIGTVVTVTVTTSKK